MRVRRWSAVVAGVLAIASCRDAVEARPMPTAEFLFAAGDSTWWVRSTPEGLRVRSAPILLTTMDDRFFEVFVTEDAEEYVEASLVSGRVFARDVLHTDSILLFEDPTVRREIAAWKRANPQAQLLDEGEELEVDEPPTAITEQIDIVDVHGPWVSFAHAIDVDVAGRTPHRHQRRRGVLDVRTGRQATLAALFGPRSAAHALSEGRAALARVRDSLRELDDERAVRARMTMAGLRFDPNAFVITDIDRRPAVAFSVTGNDDDGTAIELTLPAVAVDEQPWWREVQATLPEWARDSSSLVWNRASYIVRAQPAADGQSLELTLDIARPDSTGQGHTAQKPQPWFIANVAVPAYQLIALDGALPNRALRDALERAFDRSRNADGLSQQVVEHHMRARPFVQQLKNAALVTRRVQD